MKRELTLTDIAGYLPHGLTYQYEDTDPVILSTDPQEWDLYAIDSMIKINCCTKPVLRPMSDLCEEITERGYNDGKPFVPLVELAKIRMPQYTTFELIYDRRMVECIQKNPDGLSWFAMYAFHAQYSVYMEIDLIHRLHVDYRGLIDAGMAISVHDLKHNPYECK